MTQAREPESGRIGRHSHNYMTIGDVAEFLRAPVNIDDDPLTPEHLASGVSVDSRQVRPGDIYVALPGNRFHGMDFVGEAARRGAVAVVSDLPTAILPALVVARPRAVLGPLASAVYGSPSRDMDVYGVTGTNGKTSVAYLLDAALTANSRTTGLITGVDVRGPRTSYPGVRTTPEAPLLQETLASFRDQGVDAVAFEASSHGLAYGRVDGTYLRAGVFTNLSPDHLDFHPNMDEYFRVKASLFRAERCRLGVINVDDEYGRRLAAQIDTEMVSVSAADPAADFYVEHVRAHARGTSFTLRSPYGRFPVHLQLLGSAQAVNASAAIAAVAATGNDIVSAIGGVEVLSGIPGRLESVDAGQPFLAFVDYMHNGAGQRTVLPFLRSLTSRRVIAVIGATGDRDPGKRVPLGFNAAGMADIVIVTDESPYSEDPATLRASVVAGARSARAAHVIEQPGRASAIDLAIGLAEKGDVVVVAGRGHSPTLISGERSEPFDDRAVVRDAILHRSPQRRQLPTG
ncbi:Mur ligase family protein [Williamsia muralis]|nr:UDP-N-acetylmuramoyl-L-alanyl-D-glutamate--2,6-diaminopimelate ligase [Williamsia marianensis]